MICQVIINQAVLLILQFLGKSVRYRICRIIFSRIYRHLLGMKENQSFQRLHKRVVILSGNTVHKIQIDLLDTRMVKQFHLLTYFKKRVLFRVFRLYRFDICKRECCGHPLETRLSE